MFIPNYFDLLLFLNITYYYVFVSGGIIAFELAKYIEREYCDKFSSLNHVILSSINSPTALWQKYADPNSTVAKKHLMSDDMFIDEMHALGGLISRYQNDLGLYNKGITKHLLCRHCWG